MSDFEFETEVATAEEADEAPVSQLDTGEPEYTEAELEAIFDSLLFEGSYTEEVQVHKKLKVTFRTRSGSEGRDVVMRVDSARANLGYTAEVLRTLYNLTYSTVMINGKDISSQSFEKRLDTLERLPGPVLGVLVGKLVTFDLKVEKAVEAGSANF